MARLERLKRFLSRNRRNRLIRRLDRWVVELHQGYENRDYDHRHNGEAHLLETLAATYRPRVVFDVGANIGDWARLALNAFPQTVLHCFEPLAGPFEQLTAEYGHRSRVFLNRLALSDRSGPINLHYPPGSTPLASAFKAFSGDFHGPALTSESVEAITGDEYCTQRGIDAVDFLKIDVEGCEDRVLSGLHRLLQQGNVKVIQFEYGYVNIAAKFLLKDFYELLEPHGMRIGKIYPDHVDFRPYRYKHEDFLGPNYLAVHQSLEQVIHALGR